MKSCFLHYDRITGTFLLTMMTEIKKPSHTLMRTNRRPGNRYDSRRRISCQDLGNGDCEGWLWQKNEKTRFGSKIWKQFWFILKDRNLYCYRDPTDLVAQKLFQMPAFVVAPATEKDTSRKFAFKATCSTDQSTTYFATKDYADMSKWVSKLQLACLVVEERGKTGTNNSDATSLGDISESETEEDEGEGTSGSVVGKRGGGSPGDGGKREEVVYYPRRCPMSQNANESKSNAQDSESMSSHMTLWSNESDYLSSFLTHVRSLSTASNHVTIPMMRPPSTASNHVTISMMRPPFTASNHMTIPTRSPSTASNHVTIPMTRSPFTASNHMTIPMRSPSTASSHVTSFVVELKKCSRETMLPHQDFHCKEEFKDVWQGSETEMPHHTNDKFSPGAFNVNTSASRPTCRLEEAKVNEASVDMSEMFKITEMAAELSVSGVARGRMTRSTVRKKLSKEKRNQHHLQSRLLTLQRNLKDKEQELRSIDELLNSSAITSEKLKTFRSDNNFKTLK